MTKDEARQIATAINGALGSALDRMVKAPEPAKGNGDLPSSYKAGEIKAAVLADGISASSVLGSLPEAIYQQIKRRLLDECRVDPILLHLLTNSAPEMIVSIEPRTIDLNAGTLRGRLALLAAGGFFGEVRTQADANRELKRTGAEAHSGRLSEAFSQLVLDGFLTREENGFRLAPGAKITEKRITV